MITPDVRAEPRWAAWTSLARDFGYRACWSFPVETATGTLVGLLAMYFAEPCHPTAADLDLAALLCSTAAAIISQHLVADARAR